MERLPINLMNAAGWAKTVEQVRRLAQVPTTTHIVVGSFTPEERDGNRGGTDFDVTDDGTSTNSLGLRNGGIPYLEKHGREMVRIIHEAGKKAVLNIAGFSPDDYGIMAAIGRDLGFDIIEFNVSCPNVRDGGKEKPIICYSRLLVEQVVERADAFLGAHGIEWWYKVAPTANPLDRVWTADVLRNSTCGGITSGNAFPNISLYHPDGRPLLEVSRNYGGMGGTALKPINLSAARHFHDLLPEMYINGTGGIGHGKDLRDYEVHAGCNGGQIGTAFFEGENFHVFGEAATQYIEELERA